MTQPQKTEIIAFCSGKGGTGKTLMCSCFGYSLVRGGQGVLMIDGDPATDGLSLFLLGPKGKDYVVKTFAPINTFSGILHTFQETFNVIFEPHPIHRRGEDDHGISYEAIISGKGLYGDEAEMTAQLAVPDLDQATFRGGVRHLFDALRASGEYSYVLVDTRGGFAFESTDVCALADSFIVVTEPDYTSFYQDRNLIARINRAAAELQSPSVLRAVIVNKGTDIAYREDRPYLDNIEVSFRNELTKEFGIPFNATHGVPADIEALLAYKTQKIPYISAPGSLFSFATLSAFSDILEIVTSRWSIEQVDKWNELVNKVTAAVKEKSAKEEQREEERLKREGEFEDMRTALVTRDERIVSLERELAKQSQLYEREFARTQVLLERSLPPTPQPAPLAAQASTPSLPAGGGFTQTLGKEGKQQQPTPPQSSGPGEFTRVISGTMLRDVQEHPDAISDSPRLAGASKRGSGSAIAAASPPRPPALTRIAGGIAVVLVGGLGFVAYQSHKTAQNALEALNKQEQSSQSKVIAPDSSPAGAVGGDYAVLLSGDRSLVAKEAGAPSAAFEAQMAVHTGYNTAIYLKDGMYRTALLFDTKAEAESGLKRLVKLQGARWAGAYVVSMDTWCPQKVASRNPASFDGNVTVPIWQCSAATPKNTRAKQ